jgi:hypothetical protein
VHVPLLRSRQVLVNSAPVKTLESSAIVTSVTNCAASHGVGIGVCVALG